MKLTDVIAGATFGVIPSDAPLGAFATPRGDGVSTNLYVLWQNTSTDIQVQWIDDSVGWKGPATFPALQGADSGTQIACLTPSDDYNTSLVNIPDMCRCFFQVHGAVREVSCANRKWSVVGTVPIS